ncbi:MAG TPA: hypothetical protein VFM42_07530, partial [Sphingomicrobium sp.]|nr:hypothetical protein [Sphingomicrobium sp.]
MNDPTDHSSHRYGHLEHDYAEAFAEALCEDEAFRDWVLFRTRFAEIRNTHVIRDEMHSLRKSSAAPWWKNYFTYSCDCFGCEGGRETDVFAVIEDEVGSRFALHVEVKQPTDRFDPAVEQAKRYKMRAACWAANAPPTVPAHSQACTLLLCSAAKLCVFANEIGPFDLVITFEEIARSFPNATPSVSPIAVELPVSRFSSGQRV